MRTLSIRRIILRATPLLAIACASARSEPPPPPPPPPPAPAFQLLRCAPVTIAMSEVEVDSTGGELVVRGNRFHLPRGAVRGPGVRFNMRERETGFVGVDITPNGARFHTPAHLTLSWAQCTTLPPGFSPMVVEVKHGTIDTVGVPMPGSVNASAKTITVEIQHLTGYLIGTNAM